MFVERLWEKSKNSLVFTAPCSRHSSHEKKVYRELVTGQCGKVKTKIESFSEFIIFLWNVAVTCSKHLAALPEKVKKIRWPANFTVKRPLHVTSKADQIATTEDWGSSVNITDWRDDKKEQRSKIREHREQSREASQDSSLVEPLLPLRCARMTWIQKKCRV